MLFSYTTVWLRPTAGATLSTSIGSLTQHGVFLKARLQAETFTTLAADEKPAALFPIGIIVAIGDAAIGTQGIVTGPMRAATVSAAGIFIEEADVMGTNAGVTASCIDAAKDVICQASTAGVGMSAAVANDVGAKPKALPALGANIWFLSCVHPPVVH